MKPIIEVEHLSKKYVIGKEKQMYRTFRDLVTDKVKGVGHFFTTGHRNVKSNTQDFFALDDVSFTVQPGEVLGIIGRNGAGKSTLLRILSRITDPTDGQIIMRGRVASLLEVGTGFHPELTGRENIYLSGAVLGMTHKEIDQKFNEIVKFAEVEKFLDTPIKRYSSGMYMRLAFSVAAHLDPEILVVDEVLAVGDIAFQKKCLGKMDSVARSGRTVIFVSHQLEFLVQLCARCLLIDKGKIVVDGPSREVIDRYVNLVRAAQSQDLRKRFDRQGEGHVRFLETWVEDMSGHRVQRLVSGEPMKIVATYEVQEGHQLSSLTASFAILTVRGVPIVDLGSDVSGGSEFMATIPSKGRIECYVPRLHLNSGEFVYNILARSAKSGNELEDWVKQAGGFSVEPGDYYKNGHIAGPATLICMDQEWKIGTS